MEPVVKVTVEDHIATVMMDRPPVNAQSDQLRHELIAAFDGFTDRDDVRVAILTGFGRMFSAGADMKSRPTGHTAGEYWAFNMPPRDGYRFEQNLTVALSKSEDAAEARAAFFEKRNPNFKGR